jgi:FKBP-type peptidyl-prolyl cis-trans isomerase SlyD
MRVSKGLRVRIDYELEVKGGEVIESSAKSGPLRYVHGDGKMLAALEKRLEGLSAGDERQGEIPAGEAFGTEESLPLKEMGRKDFPADASLAPGVVFQAKGPHGEAVSFKVVAATADKITVRLLHPLVGRDLAFRVKVLSVDDPRAAASSGAPPLPPGIVELDLDEIKDG